MEVMEGNKPLKGVRVLVTREHSQAAELSTALAAKGALPIECPTIAFVPPDDWSPVDRALEHLEYYDSILFTSANAVRFFMDRLHQTGVPIDRLNRVTIFAIGPATSRELSRYGATAEPLPERYLAEGLLEIVTSKDIQGKKILFPRAKAARELLTEQLREHGATVDMVAVYRTQKPAENQQRLIELLEARAVDLVTFTSSSTVRNFVEMVGRARIHSLLSGISVACIGEITAKDARDLGLDIDIVPDEHTVSDLVLAIDSYYRQKANAQRG
jgi:uroporphyrinogen III methyltransferase/synthase